MESHSQLSRYSAAFVTTRSIVYRSQVINLKIIELKDAPAILYFECPEGNFKTLNRALHAIDRK